MRKRIVSFLLSFLLILGCGAVSPMANSATVLADDTEAVNDMSFTFYSTSLANAEYEEGSISTTSNGEQKAILNGFSSATLDVSFTIQPKTESGMLNGGLYVHAKNASSAPDGIDALNVQIERAGNASTYNVNVFNFNQSFAGRIANTIPLAYNGAINVRVIVDEVELLVYLDGSDVPSIQRKLEHFPKEGLQVGFRSQYADQIFYNISVSDVAQKPDVPTVKVLMIGNSYAQDTMTYAHEIARADGVNLVCGVLYYGGCTVKKHVENIKANGTVYKYFKNGGTDSESTNFYDVLYDEEWDYITIQTGSGQQGQKETFYPYLPWLIAHVEHLVPSAEIGLFQSWAVPSCYEGTNNSRLAPYNDNSEQMYQAIISTFADLQVENGVRFVVPSAEAFHRMNETDVCDNAEKSTSFFRDSTAHADERGRYMLGATIYRSITGNSVIGNTYAPCGLTYGTDVGASSYERSVIQRVVEGLTDKYETLDVLVKTPVLERIVVRNAVTEYSVGEYFKYESISVFAQYSDGTEIEVENFSANVFRRLTAEDCEVVIGYGGMTATIAITVSN